MLRRRHSTHTDLERTIGRLNHIGAIIPTTRHFLGRLRQAEFTAKQKRGRPIIFNREQLDDLRLWLQFINIAGNGISMNLISYRAPTRILKADACEHGVGGYSLKTGKA